jgi:hypothetical protein
VERGILPLSFLNHLLDVQFVPLTHTFKVSNVYYHTRQPLDNERTRDDFLDIDDE